MEKEINKPDAAKILIVDDVEANRFVLRNIIADMGHTPILAENGVQALKILERFLPKVILLDISMPEMDGYEFCRIVKKDPNLKEIPIIFISAFDEPSDIIKGFENGGEDYVTKPFIQEVVQARVNVHLKLHDASIQMQEANRRLHASVNEQLKQMEQEKKNVLYALVRVARENAGYEEEHMQRLQYNCRILAQAMQLSPVFETQISDVFVDTIEMAAPLCDLGNVSIPTDILQKRTPLTAEENELLKKHTITGAKILEDIRQNDDFNDFIQMSIDIAHYHHENVDGTGYPKQLKEEDIPLAAQIVSLVGAYCSLTEKRAYREAFSKEDALEILEQDVGKKFNEKIFFICKKIARQLK